MNDLIYTIDSRIPSLLSAFKDAKIGNITEAVFTDRIAANVKSIMKESAKIPDSLILHVEYVKNDGDTPFFFRLTPVFAALQGTLAAFIRNGNHDSLVNSIAETPSWNLEIDSNLFIEDLNLNPQEMVALLIDTIIESVFTSTIADRFYRSYKYYLSQISVSNRDKLNHFPFAFGIPIFEAASIHSWNVDISGDIELSNNSNILRQLNYQDDFISGLDKIYKRFGNNIFHSGPEKEHVVDSAMKFAFTLAIDFNMCKYNVKNRYISWANNTSSKIKAEYFIAVANALGIKTRADIGDPYQVVTLESIQNLFDGNHLKKGVEIVYDDNAIAVRERALANIDRNKSAALESIFKKKKKKGDQLLPSQYDIDALRVELDRIENHHDRLYVLDMIYEIMDKLSLVEDEYENNPVLRKKYEYRVESMRKELEEMRTYILNKKITQDKYKLFVKVPAGYEG